jgi:hypothetical protein
MRLLYISAIAATVLSAFSLPIYGSSFVVKSQQFEDGNFLPETMFNRIIFDALFLTTNHKTVAFALLL